MKRWFPLFYALLTVSASAHLPPRNAFPPTLGGSSLLASLDLPNGAVITNVFDDLGRLSSTSLKNASGTLFNQHAYLYAAAHRPTKQTFAAGNTLSYGHRFSFPSLQRWLTRVPLGEAGESICMGSPGIGQPCSEIPMDRLDMTIFPESAWGPSGTSGCAASRGTPLDKRAT